MTPPPHPIPKGPPKSQLVSRPEPARERLSPHGWGPMGVLGHRREHLRALALVRGSMRKTKVKWDLGPSQRTMAATGRPSTNPQRPLLWGHACPETDQIRYELHNTLKDRGGGTLSDTTEHLRGIDLVRTHKMNFEKATTRKMKRMYSPDSDTREKGDLSGRSPKSGGLGRLCMGPQKRGEGREPPGSAPCLPSTTPGYCPGPLPRGRLDEGQQTGHPGFLPGVGYPTPAEVGLGLGT